MLAFLPFCHFTIQAGFTILAPYRVYLFTILPLTALAALTFLPFYGPIGVNVVFIILPFYSLRRTYRRAIFTILAPTRFVAYHFLPPCCPGGVNIFYHFITLSPCRVYHFYHFSPRPGVPFYHFTALAAFAFVTI